MLLLSCGRRERSLRLPAWLGQVQVFTSDYLCREKLWLLLLLRWQTVFGGNFYRLAF